MCPTANLSNRTGAYCRGFSLTLLLRVAVRRSFFPVRCWPYLVVLRCPGFFFAVCRVESPARPVAWYSAAAKRLHVLAQPSLILNDPVDVFLAVLHLFFQLRDHGLLCRDFLERFRHLSRDRSLLHEHGDQIFVQIRKLVTRRQCSHLFHWQGSSGLGWNFDTKTVYSRRFLLRLLSALGKLPLRPRWMLDHQRACDAVLISRHIKRPLMQLAHLRQHAFQNLHSRDVLRLVVL